MEAIIVILLTIVCCLISGVFWSSRDKMDVVVVGTIVGLFTSFAIAGTFQIIVRTFNLLGTSW
ncbi:hypothetical protein [Bacillus phage vB_BanS-Thrax2]|nr:hypothetical protein [Bacillus phage vB_BanS-Thrax2]